MTQRVATSATSAASDRAAAEPSGSSAPQARRILLVGGVQGLGVRPAIYRLATQLALGGRVQNTARGVEIEIEGFAQAVRAFDEHLLASLPRAALVRKLSSEPMPPTGRTQFAIVHEPTSGPLIAHLPEDRALCAECAAEINDRGDRRHNYPFTSCTQCGPRYTVIHTMPFERPDTAMNDFPFCPHCQAEYTRPGDRRFHAQTMACPACGPQVAFISNEGSTKHHGENALHAAVDLLRTGRILGLKGLGGYQLLVDATNQRAVERLRNRKLRHAKPLAVMAATLEDALQLADLNPTEKIAWLDASAPIVLGRATSPSKLAPAIHPHLNSVGLMRPTTPLHAMLARGFPRPLVCTSANLEGCPLEYANDQAEERLSDVADAWLHHNREIVRPIDDSVVRVIADKRVSIRLARGLAPLALDLPAIEPILALGGYLKSAMAWSNGSQCALGPHLGDLETVPARERFLSHLNDMLHLYRFRPRLLVHDLHPDYFSTQWALRQTIPRLAVQHHHAHVAASMLEHGWLERRVLGVAWDGTGYGPDGTIWGGEFLLCAGRHFDRIARLRPFRLPGNETAIREPWRIALSVFSQLESSPETTDIPDWGISAAKRTQVFEVVRRPSLSPVTSSAGRLFDAAAAMILGISHSEFEGQAAMRLEAAADTDARGWYHFPVTDDSPAELDWRPLFAGLLADRRRGTDPATLAMKFHRSLAHGIMGVCRRWRNLPVVLCGGVFQNKLLTELVAEMMMESSSQDFGLPGVIPPGDGGLAAGQLAIASSKLR